MDLIPFKTTCAKFWRHPVRMCVYWTIMAFPLLEQSVQFLVQQRTYLWNNSAVVRFETRDKTAKWDRNSCCQVFWRRGLWSRGLLTRPPVQNGSPQTADHLRTLGVLTPPTLVRTSATWSYLILSGETRLVHVEDFHSFAGFPGNWQYDRKKVPCVCRYYVEFHAFIY